MAEIDTSDTSRDLDRFEELERTCFVIMPFGRKTVGEKEVDFDKIYELIFEPAIKDVTTPEAQDHYLIPARTDKDTFAGSITQEMFEYIMYCRMAFADISGLNANVFYEIGARHSAQESGTVLFRQRGHDIPFDIRTIKVFEYGHESDDKIKESRAFITKVLSESLRRNRLDSPVRLALRAQWGGGPSQPAAPSPPSGSASGPSLGPPSGNPADQESLRRQWCREVVERFLRDGEEAVRLGDLDMAITNYWAALRFDPLNLMARMRLGLTLKRQGRHYEALEEFTTLTKLAPDYGEAWKEKGVVEGLIARLIPQQKRDKATWLPDGSEALTRATQLIPSDFDAWASLGGILKNVHGDLQNAHQMYAEAARVSDGHPYPLLNALKLEALSSGSLNLEPVQEQLEKAAELRRAQCRATPPADAPWCFFDLAEINLYRNSPAEFLASLNEGIAACTASWQPQTFRDSLSTLVDRGLHLDGLSEGLQRLDAAITGFARPAAGL